MSSGSVVSLSSFNLLFFTQVLTVLTSTVKYNDYVTDKGKNVSIPCDANGTIMWVKENFNNPQIIQTGKFLILTNVSESDRGIYVCFASVPTRSGSTKIMPVEVENPNEDTNSTRDESNLNTETHQNNSYKSSNSNIHKTPTTANATTIAAAAVAAANTTSTTPNTAVVTHNTTTPTAAANKHTTTALTTSLPKTSPRPLVSSFDDVFFSPAALANSSTIDEIEEDFEAYRKINLTVRTPPGPVTQLYFKASTILGFLIWRFNKSMSGGYPVRSFTAEFRNVSYKQTPYNSSMEHEWSRMDPINIAPNVRQMEVYRLEPNTTYEFRIWANNQLGSGAVVTTNVTTLPETKEEDLIRLIQPDLDNFDPRIWIVAVSIVLGTLVILAIGLCIVLSKECYQASHKGYEDGWDSIELLPNIILNPGFCESDGQERAYTRTVIFGEDDDSDGYESESDHEPRMEKFKRKVSIFFTGPTIKRI